MNLKHENLVSKMSWQKSNCHHERFGKLIFLALALCQIHFDVSPFDFSHLEQATGSPTSWLGSVSKNMYPTKNFGGTKIKLRVESTCQCLGCVIELFKVLEFNTENNKKVQPSWRSIQWTLDPLQSVNYLGCIENEDPKTKTEDPLV